MPVEIRNLTLRPVLMRLNSGASLHLSPGMTSPTIADQEVERNEKVRKLQAKRVIALVEAKDKAKDKAKPAASQGEGKSSTRKKK